MNRPLITLLILTIIITASALWMAPGRMSRAEYLLEIIAISAAYHTTQQTRRDHESR